jgi:hypothetical protein
MLILGFGNKARQGKDTAAEAIRDYYEHKMSWNEDERRCTEGNTKVGVFKFATALYEEVNQFLKVYSGQDNVGTWQNFSPDLTVDISQWVYCNNESHDHGIYKNVMIPDWVTPEPNPEVSALAPYGKHPKLLQWWGTEFRRAQDPDYWTKKLFASIPANLDIAIVTDVRFQNEADGIRQRGGYNVNIQRLRDDGTRFYSSDRPVDHPSETSLDGYDWDFYLKTKGSHIALLGEQAITLVEYLRGLNG